MKEIYCVWCGKKIESTEDEATMDTCESCEEYFEDNIPQIAKTLNEMLRENELLALDESTNKANAMKSYSLITAIHMLSSRPCIEFKDSKFSQFL